MAVMPDASPALCPLCGQANQCAMEIQRATGVPQAACWCTDVRFDADLLASIPQQARGLRCVCAACAGAAARDDRPSVRS